MRKVRSDTRPISTPSTSRIRSTIASACSGSWVSIVRSMRIWLAPDAVTSRPVTTPPAASMTPVISLTAVARAGQDEADGDGVGDRRGGRHTEDSTRYRQVGRTRCPPRARAALQ